MDKLTLLNILDGEKMRWDQTSHEYDTTSDKKTLLIQYSNISLPFVEEMLRIEETHKLSASIGTIQERLLYLKMFHERILDSEGNDYESFMGINSSIDVLYTILNRGL